MKDEIKKRFINFIKEEKLLNKGDRVVVGLSGGPDSVCLINLLSSIKEEWDLEIAAVHINHMIRGAEADKDEKYAGRLCDKLGIKYFSRKIDVNSIAKMQGVSSEAAGRDARYNMFIEIMNKLNYNKVEIGRAHV